MPSDEEPVLDPESHLVQDVRVVAEPAQALLHLAQMLIEVTLVLLAEPPLENGVLVGYDLGTAI